MEFNLNITYDGDTVTVNYNDGTNKEHYPAHSQDAVEKAVLEAVRTAMSPEED